MCRPGWTDALTDAWLRDQAAARLGEGTAEGRRDEQAEPLPGSAAIALELNQT